MRVEPDTSPRRQPRQERADRTVQALLDATAVVLVRDGYDGASTNRIAREAGLSIGTLYQYFPNKEAVVLALARRNGEQEVADVRTTLQLLPEAPLPEVAKRLISALIERHRVNPALHRVFITQVPQIGGLSGIREMDERTAVLLSEHMQQRRPHLSPEDIKRQVFVVMHAAEGLVHQAVIEHPAYLDDPAFARELVHLVVSYLGDDDDDGDDGDDGPHRKDRTNALDAIPYSHPVPEEQS